MKRANTLLWATRCSLTDPQIVARIGQGARKSGRSFLPRVRRGIDLAPLVAYFILVTIASSSCSNALGPSASTEDGIFVSGTTRLSYALDIPVVGSAPYPTVVFGHDSGPKTKNSRKDWARRFVAQGVAVFRFDKRGVGDSEGVYERGFADFELLTGDLVSAVEFVAQDTRIDPNRIGLLGSSQAGWIIPMVATRSGNVAFTIILSGPAVTVGQHNLWDEAADDENLTISQLSDILATFVSRPGDFDPRPFIEGMSAPALWLLGDQDRIIPARESAQIVRQIGTEFDKAFTVIVYPDGDHGLRNVKTGKRIDFWADLLPWLNSIIR